MSCGAWSEILAAAYSYGRGIEAGWALTNTPSTTPYAALLARRDSVRALAFAPGGQQLASGSWDGVVKVWDARGQLLRSLDAGSLVLAVDFGPDWTRESREAVALAMHERCGAASPLRPLEVRPAQSPLAAPSHRGRARPGACWPGE